MLIPAHILTHHRQAMKIYKTQNDHCVYAYVVATDGEEVSLCVCLTCKKGVMSDGYDGNGSRWVTLHSRKAECRAAHAGALAALRQELGTPPPTAQPSPPPSVPLESMWRDWKADGRLRPLMEEVEDTCKWACEDEDPVFDPSDGLRQVIVSAMGYKKEMELSKAELTKIAIRHDEELMVYRDALAKQSRAIGSLESAIRQQEHENADLRRRLAALEKENEQMKTGNP